MTKRRKSAPSKKVPRQTEENLALEISEDKRLLRLGINPDDDPVKIMMKVHQIAEALRAEESKE